MKEKVFEDEHIGIQKDYKIIILINVWRLILRAEFIHKIYLRYDVNIY